MLLPENRESPEEKTERRARSLRRQAKQNAASISDDLRFKLLEEQSAPLRSGKQSTPENRRFNSHYAWASNCNKIAFFMPVDIL